MLERTVKVSAMALVLCLASPACSGLSKAERQQAAQQKHLRKTQKHQLDEQRKLIAEKNRVLYKPQIMGDWSTKVTLEPLPGEPTPSPVETTATENPPSDP